jgi:hypothetical protein
MSDRSTKRGAAPSSRAIALLLGAFALAGLPAPAAAQGRIMPELPAASAEFWVNGPPLKKADFAGQVVLIEIWTST